MSALSDFKRQSLRRLARELQDILQDPPDGISGHPKDGNLYKWIGYIQGPEDSVYAKGIFPLDIDIPLNYPLEPPIIRFATKVYHPNVDSDSGYISLSVLGDEACPALTIPKLLLSIRAYLGSPDTTDPVMPEIAREYLSDRAAYEKTAKEWTENFALPIQRHQLRGKPR